MALFADNYDDPNLAGVSRKLANTTALDFLKPGGMLNIMTPSKPDIYKPGSPAIKQLQKYVTPNTYLGNIASGIPQVTDNPMLSLGQNTDISSLFQSFKPSEYSGSQVEKSFGIDAQKEAEARNATEVQPSTNPSEYESGILEQSKRQNDLLLQAANNAYANQERNAQNQVINYNNNQQAQMNRTANSMSSGSFTPTYQQAVYTPQSMNFGTQQAVQENPYAQFFNKNSMQITPSKDGLKPKDIPMDAITQNGQSIWNTDGTMRKNTSIKQDTKDFFNKNAGGYLPRAYETSQDRINKMRAFGKQQYQGSYNPNMGGY